MRNSGDAPTWCVAGRCGALLIAVLFAAGGDAQAQPGGPTKVAAARAEMRKLPATMRLVGTVEPWVRSVIGAEVEGLVKEMPVRQGDRVEAGGVIAKLKDETLAADVNAAKARLAALQARLDELSAGTRAEELARLKAEHAEAQAVLQRWTSEKQRMAALQSTGQANEKEMYETEAEFRAAEQRVVRAQAMYEQGVNGPRVEELARARFEVAEQQAVVERRERDWANTVIRAPFTGYVVRPSAEVGQWVERGGAIVELIELDRVLIRVDVPESAVQHARVGEAVRVLVEAVSEEFAGSIRHVVPQADLAARTFPVQVEVANPEGKLKSGMFAWATVVSGPATEVVAVPKDAVDVRQGVPHVCLVMTSDKGAVATPTPVTTGANIDDWIAITSPNVKADAMVVVRGNEGIPFPGPVEVSNSPDRGSN